MCRLFGFRASVPSAVHRSLVRERNALRAQSSEHPDGWGLAWYVGGEPQVARGLGPAFQDDDFEALASYVSSDAVLAHVRKASVGRIAVENTHPFDEGRWVFAHNGTVPEWDALRAGVEGLLPPERLARLAGTTDSERCFQLFLAELERGGRDPHDPALPLDAVLDALARATAQVVTACGAQNPSLTFLCTNGRLLAASRRGRTLFYSHDKAPGVAHPEADEKVRRGEPGLCHLLVASERISDDDVWLEVPEGALLGVDASLRLTLRPPAVSQAA